MHVHPEELPAQRARMNTLHKARAHITEVVAKSIPPKASTTSIKSTAENEMK